MTTDDPRQIRGCQLSAIGETNRKLLKSRGHTRHAERVAVRELHAERPRREAVVSEVLLYDLGLSDDAQLESALGGKLRLEYRMPKMGNSGVAVRAPLQGQPHLDGMEIQLLDDENWKVFTTSQYDAKGGEWQLEKVPFQSNIP